MTERTYETWPTINDPRRFEATASGMRFTARSVTGYHGAASSCTVVRQAEAAPGAAVEAAPVPPPLLHLDLPCNGLLADERQLYVLTPRGLRAFSFAGSPTFATELDDATWPTTFTDTSLLVRTATSLVRVNKTSGVIEQTWPYAPSTRILVLAADGECIFALLHEQPTATTSSSRLVAFSAGSGSGVPSLEVLIGEVIHDTPALNPAIRVAQDQVAFRLNTAWTTAPRPRCGS